MSTTTQLQNAHVSVLSTDANSVIVKMDKEAFEDWYDSQPSSYEYFEKTDPREVLAYLDSIIKKDE